MKKRVRFGIRLSLPFNLFPHAATFVAMLTEEQLANITAHVMGIRGILPRAGKPDLATRLFVETQEA
jgi:hypothetical protein